MGHELLDIFGALHGKIITHAGSDHHPLDALYLADLAIEPDKIVVRGVQVFADIGEYAGRTPAQRLDLRILARHPVHVGGRPADVRDHAGKTWRLVADALDLPQDRALRAVLDDAALVLGDRAERAAAETAAHDRHRELDHLPRRDLGIAVGRMRRAGGG